MNSGPEEELFSMVKFSRCFMDSFFLPLFKFNNKLSSLNKTN